MARVPLGKLPLLINLDATSVAYSFQRGRGNVVAGAAAETKVSRSETRGAVTHVAMICNDSAVQPKLPQFIIGNHHKFTLAFMQAASVTKPPNVVLLREKSAWNSLAIMRKVLQSLADALQHFSTYQAILVLDTASCHTSPKLVRLAASLNIWISFIPAKLTCMLQPLDTHCFAGYKDCVQKLFRQERSKAFEGRVSSISWINILYHVCTKFMCSKKWLHAFERTGLLGDRVALLSSTVRKACVLEDYGKSDGNLPCKEDMQVIMPRGREFPYVDMWWKPSGRRHRLVLVWGGARLRSRL